MLELSNQKEKGITVLQFIKIKFLLYVPYATKLVSKQRPHMLPFGHTSSGFTVGSET